MTPCGSRLCLFRVDSEQANGVGLEGSKTGKPAGSPGMPGRHGEPGKRDSAYEPRLVAYRSLLLFLRQSSDRNISNPSVARETSIDSFYGDSHSPPK